MVGGWLWLGALLLLVYLVWRIRYARQQRREVVEARMREVRRVLFDTFEPRLRQALRDFAMAVRQGEATYFSLGWHDTKLDRHYLALHWAGLWSDAELRLKVYRMLERLCRRLELQYEVYAQVDTHPIRFEGLWQEKLYPGGKLGTGPG